MNIFWLMAIAMAAFIALIIFTGRIRIRGQLLADRTEEPKRFWFCVAVFSVTLIGAVAQAISVSISN